MVDDKAQDQVPLKTELEQRLVVYQKQLLQDNYDTDIICQGFVNLTTGKVEQFYFSQADQTLPFNSSYEHNLDVVLDNIAIDKDREKCFDLFVRSNLLKRFREGLFDTEYTYTRKAEDAGLYWTRLHAHAARIVPDGDIIAHFTSTDVSDHFLESRIVKRLAETQFDYVAIIDIPRRQIYMRNLKTDQKATNPRLTADYDQDCLFAVKKVVAPEDQEETLRNMSLENIITHLEKNETYAYAFSVIAPNGQRFRKELHYCYLTEEKQNILFSRVDVTKQYLEEQTRRRELQEALEQAGQSERSKENFFSQLSHDIRTPMNGVLGVAELAQGCGDITKYEQALADIKTSGKFMMSLLNDVLDISKIGTKTYELQVEPYLYSDFEEEIKAIILPRARGKNIRVEMRCQELPTGCALFDKLRLQQIFINLLSNAVKYNRPGGWVLMTTEYKPDQDGQSYFEFHVRDNGIGMSEDFLQNHLFHEFEQEKAGGDTNGGTGLGLAIVKRLVDTMKGTISCTSREGVGTDFKLYIPSKVVDVPVKPDHTILRPDISGLAGKRVLICEDILLNVKIASLMLKRVGIICEGAANGQIAVDKFRSSPSGYYAAILMDIRMPVMDGLSAAKTIRSLDRPDAKTVPIIAMSANAFAEDVQQAKAVGMDGYIVKPIEPKKMYEALAGLMQ